jgi:hypothetical protein
MSKNNCVHPGDIVDGNKNIWKKTGEKLQKKPRSSG